MARPDPDGLIELGGDIFIAHPPIHSRRSKENRPKAHAHKHRHQRATAIRIRMEINGRFCVVCGEPIPMHRQANALFCEAKGPCANKVDNLRRRTVKRMGRSASEIQEMYQRLINGTLRGAASVSAITTILMWLEFNGPNIAAPSKGW